MTIINSNTNALGVKQSITINQRDMVKAMAQLATGQRINSAADDAAGLGIGNKMTAQIRSLDMAVRNANDGISLLQTADAATAEMSAMLLRMQELAIQSANDTYSDDDRTSLQKEFAELQTAIDNITKNTEWNGMRILDGGAGNAGSVRFQVGAQGADSITVDMSSIDVGAIASIQTLDISTSSGATGALNTLGDAMVLLDESRSLWGAVVNRLTYAADSASNVSMNTQASRSRINDTEYAQTTAELARTMILDQAGAAMLSQANQQPMYVLALLR